MKMSDLPRRVYRAKDDRDFAIEPDLRRKPTGYTAQLEALMIGHSVTLPTTSSGLILRVAKRTGMSFTNQHLKELKQIIVTRKS